MLKSLARYCDYHYLVNALKVTNDFDSINIFDLIKSEDILKKKTTWNPIQSSGPSCTCIAFQKWATLKVMISG
jgi:hypothetical protein